MRLTLETSLMIYWKGYTILDPNKAHGHDKISIRLIKKCDKPNCKHLELIFNRCINNRSFPLEWKKANIVPVHRNGDKKCLKNYWPVSLLPICGKVLERLTFNEMFRFLIEKNLISSNQSGFKPGDSLFMTGLKWKLLNVLSESYFKWKSFLMGRR